MFPLGRQAAVPGHHRPLIRQYPYMTLAEVDHRFDGEGHARFQHDAGAGAAVMQYLRFLVEDLADAMTAILAHDAAMVSLGVGLDRMADVAETNAGADHLDADLHAIVSHLHQASRRRLDLAHGEHAAGIAVVAVLDHGDVDIHDIAVLQFLVGGNAVADLVVDRGADGFRETVVVEWRWNGLLHIDDIIVTQPIQLVGGDTGRDMGLDHLQHIGGEAAGHAHSFDFFGCLDCNGHRGEPLPVVERGRLWYKARAFGNGRG